MFLELQRKSVRNFRCWLPMQNTYYDYIYIAPVLIVLGVRILLAPSSHFANLFVVRLLRILANQNLKGNCHRMAGKISGPLQSRFLFLFQINVLFLISIVFVLFTKLRATPSMDMQTMQYR